MILPGPPYRLSPTFARGMRRRVWLSASLALFFLPAGGLWIGCIWHGIELDRALWASGATAASASVGAKEETRRFVFHDYSLDISFIDAAGEEHHARETIHTLFGGVDTSTAPVIRYDPARPYLVVSSWAIDAIPRRQALGVTVVVIFWIAGAAFFWTLISTLRRWRDVRVCTRQGIETEIEVLARTESKLFARNVVTYTMRWPAGQPEARTFKHEVVPEHGEPMWLDTKGTRVLGLHAADAKRPVVILANLLPLELDEAERMRIGTKLGLGERFAQRNV